MTYAIARTSKTEGMSDAMWSILRDIEAGRAITVRHPGASIRALLKRGVITGDGMSTPYVSVDQAATIEREERDKAAADAEGEAMVDEMSARLDAVAHLEARDGSQRPERPALQPSSAPYASYEIQVFVGEREIGVWKTIATRTRPGKAKEAVQRASKPGEFARVVFGPLVRYCTPNTPMHLRALS